MVRACCVVASVALAWAPASAHAGRSEFGWLFGPEVMPERGVELQSWVTEQTGQPGEPQVTNLLWGPTIGVTDQLEISLPIEAGWTAASADSAATFTLTDYGLDVRYRLVSTDPVEAGPLVPLVRVAIKRDIAARDSALLEGNVVLGYQQGRVHALLDAGAIAVVGGGQQLVELHPGVGVSVQAVGDLRLGAEAFAQAQVSGGSDAWAAVGPNLAWTHGRFWLSAAFGVGVYHIRTAPRILWGIAF